MDVLVSLCNRDEEHPEALVSVDSLSGATVPVELPEKGLGAMGLAALADTIFVVVRLGRPSPEEPERSRLYSLDAETLLPLAEHDFELGRDVHSLWPLGGRLYAVSTGTDELLELELDGVAVAAERVHWRPDPSAPRADLHHLNSVYFWDGALVVSGFGRKPKPDADWKEARGGFVWHLGRDEQVGPALYQPHTLLADREESLLVCESPLRTVRALDGPASQPLAAYTRGLALADERLLVGLSLGRSRSKSTGVMNNLAAEGAGAIAGRCGLAQLDQETFDLLGFASLERYGREVYDLLAADRPWPEAAEDLDAF